MGVEEVPGPVSLLQLVPKRDVLTWRSCRHSAVMAPKDNDKFLGLHQAGKLLRPDQPGHVMARMVLDPPKELSGKYVE